MVKYLHFIICFIIAISLNAQDTILIDLTKALSIAELGYNRQTQVKPDLSAAIKLPPTAINFMYGQLYSPENGWQLELKQDFGPLFQYNKQLNIDKLTYEVEESKFEIREKQYILNVKSVYLHWIYLLNKQQILELKQEYADKYREVALIKEELGDIELFEKVKAESTISEIETEQILGEYDIDIAQNNLRKLLNTESYLLPANKILETYIIEKQSDTSQYSGRKIVDIYYNEYKKSEAETNLLKAKALPSFNAGMFYQNIGSYNNLIGVEAGIAIPLWCFPQKTEIKKQTILSENALMQYNRSIQNSFYDIKNIISALDKCFIKIRHFQNYALPEAELLISTASAKYKLEEIPFDEFFREIITALQIKLDYIDCINEYNQTALQLELYSN